MEAFKAANPNAIFEDFVRWQSPRDWIVEDNGEDQDVLDEDAYNKKHGRLSMRMTEPGNLWIEIWKVYTILLITFFELSIIFIINIVYYVIILYIFI